MRSQRPRRQSAMRPCTAPFVLPAGTLPVAGVGVARPTQPGFAPFHGQQEPPGQNGLRPREAAERRKLLRYQRIDVGIAMGIAGIVNMTMLIVAATLFHDSG